MAMSTFQALQITKEAAAAEQALQSEFHAYLDHNYDWRDRSGAAKIAQEDYNELWAQWYGQKEAEAERIDGAVRMGEVVADAFAAKLAYDYGIDLTKVAGKDGYTFKAPKNIPAAFKAPKFQSQTRTENGKLVTTQEPADYRAKQYALEQRRKKALADKNVARKASRVRRSIGGNSTLEALRTADTHHSTGTARGLYNSVAPHASAAYERLRGAAGRAGEFVSKHRWPIGAAAGAALAAGGLGYAMSRRGEGSRRKHAADEEFAMDVDAAVEHYISQIEDGADELDFVGGTEYDQAVIDVAAEILDENGLLE